MSTVRQIAKDAGVSTATVSRVLNNHPKVSVEARNKVLSVANDARYTHSVGRKSTTNIAFLYTGDPSLGSPFDAALMQGMSVGMQAYDYDLMVLDANRARQPQESWSQMFIRKGIRGAVLRTDLRTRNVCEDIAEEGFPSVVVGDRFDHAAVSYIYSDSKATSTDAVRHLIELGHRHIAVVTNVVDDSDHRDRIEGYSAALAEAGLCFDERLIIRSPAHRIGGTQALRRLLTMRPRPTAVFVVDPASAAGMMNEARAEDIEVPKDLSIVGFDDGETRFTVWPQLTCVCQDANLMGRQAFDALHALLDQEGRKKPVQIAMPTWFEVHQSTSHVSDLPPSSG